MNMVHYQLIQHLIMNGLELVNLLHRFDFLLMNKINDISDVVQHDLGQYDRLLDQHKLVYLQ